jgi:hypothetical protein
MTTIDTIATIDQLKALRTAAHALHPNVGAWLISATRREAFALSALMQHAQTWHDTVRAKWLAAVIADTCAWSFADAWYIAHRFPNSEGWHADDTPRKWWDELRFYEEARCRDEEEGVA